MHIVTYNQFIYWSVGRLSYAAFLNPKGLPASPRSGTFLWSWLPGEVCADVG